MIRAFRLFVEGVRFGWSLRPWPRAYLLWRLGTVYGIYPNNDGTKPPKTLRQLLGEAWRDRKQGARFLLWRREMLIAARRPR